MLGYFRANNNFKLNHFVKEIFEEYVPVSKEVNMNKVKARINKIAENDKFDSDFNIDKDVLKGKRLHSVIPVAGNKIELRIKEFVTNLKEIIKSEEIQGQRYIVIRSDEGHEELDKLLNQSND